MIIKIHKRRFVIKYTEIDPRKKLRVMYRILNTTRLKTTQVKKRREKNGMSKKLRENKWKLIGSARNFFFSGR